MVEHTLSNIEIPKSRGTYTLIIALPLPAKLRIGSLGHADFPAGTYAYTGSALGKSSNLNARVVRHLKAEKKVWWHIDYLLGVEGVSVKALLYAESMLRAECEIAQRIGEIAQAEALVRGFGASDCRHGCGSHLHYLRGLNSEEAMSRVHGIYARVFGCSQLIRVE